MKKSLHDTEHYVWGDACDGWHLLKSDNLSVIKERMPKGTSEQLHCHEYAQQLFYILSGKASFEINGKTEEVKANERIHIPPRTLHRIYNEQEEDLEFLLVSAPQSQGDRIDIVDYTEELKEHVKTLNVEWLERYFFVEPNDIIQLSGPKTEIIDKGGMIFYVAYNKEVVGTASLLKVEEDIYELGKMAVTHTCQGHGIGNVLMEHCINMAKAMGIKKLILYSNKSLGPAIHLYKKYGFEEEPMEAGHYERANIKMGRIVGS